MPAADRAARGGAAEDDESREYDPPDDDLDDLDDLDDQGRGWMPGTGWCGHAGGEHCDFCRPHRNALGREWAAIEAGELEPAPVPYPDDEP